MKYYKYTLIDVASRTPVSIEPAKRGPAFPEGLTFIFSIEQASSSGIPVFYGSADEGWEVEEWMEAVSQETLITLFKQELKERITLKRKSFIKSGVVLKDGSRFDSSKSTQEGLASVISAMTLDKSIKSVDFESYSWIKLTLPEAKDILKAINKQTQLAFSWCCKMHQEVDKAETIDDCLTISNLIAGGVK